MTQRGRAGARPANRRSGSRGRDASDENRSPAAPRIDLVAARARVRSVIEPVVVAAGYDLEEVNLSRAGRRHVVRVLVDADGGISLDDVAVVSREISAALDAAEEAGGELLAGEYQLEVGSPGVDRPLTLPRHWRRNVGRLVAVTVAGRSSTGRVVAADDAGIVLDSGGTTSEVAYADLGPGRVQIEFKRLDEAVFADEDDLDDEQDDDDVDVDDEDGEGEDR
ncbi:ribosome maturation factor RimP [Couchioplanes caeruleus]|uniref:Ribosome maturation factor RimP n=2 Tax=Couchioplanes caeruleus TaxID=56438 RepID=A0A1K0GMR3_9ACTN|nr:ribosome maturation factor RimP [Couchioplanes caeruleus]OJF10491.1 ribosome maturation factor RimP [Couchioplanes caeruleus subsp. caeruleus]ROP32574.1 ribosome maturation factor RimP [Couchioplanes caeruleus]